MIDNLFLSVGAMKAGTTWLYEQLKNHPEIYFTPEKEIHYFANKVGIENQLNHRNRILKLKEVMQKYASGNAKFISQNIAEIYWYSQYAYASDISNNWYENLFDLNKNKKYCADFSNLYCQMDENGWDNVRKIANKLRVIYTLRDPLDRLWSHYKFHMKWVNREDEAIEAGFENFKNLLDQKFFWINAEYTVNYKNIIKSLKDDELMLLYFDDFRENPELMLSSIQNFLEIECIKSNEDMINKKVNSTKPYDMPKIWSDYALEKLKPIYLEMQDIGIGKDTWFDKLG